MATATYTGLQSPYGSSASVTPFGGGGGPPRMGLGQAPQPQAAQQAPQPGYHGTQPPGQAMSGLGGGGQFGSMQFRQPTAYNGANYSGKATGMPFGQANAMTWNQIGGALGASGNQMQNALGGLNNYQQSLAAEYAQRNMGIPVPGDGRGVGPIVVHQGISPLNHPAPAAGSGPMPSPQPGLGMNHFNSITDLVRSRFR